MNNVLAVFDGMRCASLALTAAQIPVAKYYSSEIDKHANKLGRVVYPGAIEVGDVRFVTSAKKSLITEFTNDLDTKYKFIHDDIQFLIGGSPCQSFSFAGKKNGMSTTCEIRVTSLEHYLQLRSEGFEFEGESYLFWEFVRLLKEFKPRYFFLENVKMTKDWQKVISKALGVNPIELDSSLISAQSRKRLYWTNLGMKPNGLFGDMQSIITMPKDKGILLKHILEPVVDKKYYITPKTLEYYLKNSEKQANLGNKFEFSPIDDFDTKSKTLVKKEGNQMQNNYIKIDKEFKIKTNQNKASCFTAGANSGGNHTDMDLILETDKKIIQLNPSNESQGRQPYQQNRIYDSDGITPSLMAHKSDLIIRLNDSHSGRVYNTDNKSVNLCANGGGMGAKTGLYFTENNIRRLTPRECGRLQTVPETILDAMLNCGVSDTQLYKVFGNGWTIDAITHFLNYYHHE